MLIRAVLRGIKLSLLCRRAHPARRTEEPPSVPAQMINLPVARSEATSRHLRRGSTNCKPSSRKPEPVSHLSCLSRMMTPLYHRAGRHTKSRRSRLPAALEVKDGRRRRQWTTSYPTLASCKQIFAGISAYGANKLL